MKDGRRKTEDRWWNEMNQRMYSFCDVYVMFFHFLCSSCFVQNFYIQSSLCDYDSPPHNRTIIIIIIIYIIFIITATLKMRDNLLALILFNSIHTSVLTWAEEISQDFISMRCAACAWISFTVPMPMPMPVVMNFLFFSSFISIFVSFAYYSYIFGPWRLPVFFFKISAKEQSESNKREPKWNGRKKKIK